MITFTKEQLIASAHARIEFAEMMLAGELEPLKERTWSIELELARIALASLEAKSRKLFTCSGCGAEGLDEPLESKCHCNEDGALWVEGIVYTAPPAPVSVPDAMEMDDDFDSAFEHGKAVGWNACRAAMLQGAEPVTTANKLPEGWVACSERMPEFGTEIFYFCQDDARVRGRIKAISVNRCGKCGDILPVKSCPCAGDSACWVTQGWHETKLAV